MTLHGAASCGAGGIDSSLVHRSLVHTHRKPLNSSSTYVLSCRNFVPPYLLLAPAWYTYPSRRRLLYIPCLSVSLSLCPSRSPLSSSFLFLLLLLFISVTQCCFLLPPVSFLSFCLSLLRSSFLPFLQGCCVCNLVRMIKAALRRRSTIVLERVFLDLA